MLVHNFARLLEMNASSQGLSSAPCIHVTRPCSLDRCSISGLQFKEPSSDRIQAFRSKKTHVYVELSHIGHEGLFQLPLSWPDVCLESSFRPHNDPNRKKHV